MTDLTPAAQTLTLSAAILAGAAAGPSELAAALSAAMVTDTRADGSSFVKFADLDGAASEIAHSIAFGAHDDGSRLPDDWTYSQLQAMLEGAASDGEDYDAGESVEFRTSALLAWLPGNVHLVESYIDECGWGGSLDGAIMVARSMELSNIFANLWAELVDVCDEYAADDLED